MTHDECKRSATPKPAPDAVRSADAFDIGFAWALGLRGQNIEDSRAVGRTLTSDLFAGLSIDLSGFDSFKTADEGIVDAKRRIKAALAAPVPSPEGAGETVAHRYHPSAEHMGDCSVCGNIREHSLHAPVRGDREEIARIIRCTVMGSTETTSGVSGEYDAADAILSLPGQPGAGERWYLGAQNDGLFIINAEPRPSNDDAWHDRPNGPTFVLNVTELPQAKAQAVVNAMNRLSRQPQSNSEGEQR